MLSRMGGHKHGVAKSASPVIVRIPTYTVKPDGTAWIAGLRRILDDVGDGKKAVLSMSIYWARTKKKERFSDEMVPTFQNTDGSDAYDYIRSRFAELLRRLADKGVTLVTGSGNDAKVSCPGRDTLWSGEHC